VKLDNNNANENTSNKTAIINNVGKNDNNVIGDGVGMNKSKNNLMGSTNCLDPSTLKINVNDPK